MNKKAKWYWREHEDAERCNGPFDNKELAIDDAQAEIDNDDLPQTIVVGKCAFINAENYIRDNLDDVLEQLEESAGDDVSFWDDEIFDVGDPKGAQASLTGFFKKWCAHFVSSSVYTISIQEEKVTLTKKS